MIDRLLALLGIKNDPIPPLQNGAPPPSEAERHYEDVRQATIHTIRQVDRETERIRRSPSWESLIKGRGR